MPIRDLDISGNPIGIVGVCKLVNGFTTQGSANLLSLDVSRTNMFYHTSNEFVHQLQYMINNGSHLSLLRKLNLSENLLGDEAASELLPSLYRLEKLEELCLSDDHLGDRFLNNL